MTKLYTEPITGYRTWLMHPSKNVITGCIHQVEWPFNDDAKAICRKNLDLNGKLYRGKRRTRHKTPSLKCQCGFYAYGDLNALKRSTSVTWGSFIRSVRGVILAWGRVQLTERGFRAEYARPVAFLKWEDRVWQPNVEAKPTSKVQRDIWNDRLEQIAEVYQIPLLDTEDELRLVAAELGKPISS